MQPNSAGFHAIPPVHQTAPTACRPSQEEIDAFVNSALMGNRTGIEAFVAQHRSFINERNRTGKPALFAAMDGYFGGKKSASKSSKTYLIMMLMQQSSAKKKVYSMILMSITLNFLRS